MTAKELLLHQTERAYDADEMCLRAAVRGLTTEGARRHPEGLWHRSIWEIIDHVARCDLMYMTQAFGPPAEEIAEPGKTLDSLLAYLDATHAYRVHCLETLSDSALDEPIPTEWHGESAANLFWVLLQHDVDHAAQIAVIREALGL